MPSRDRDNDDGFFDQARSATVSISELAGTPLVVKGGWTAKLPEGGPKPITERGKRSRQAENESPRGVPGTRADDLVAEFAVIKTAYLAT